MDKLARLQNPDEWNVIPHGMDLSMFVSRDQAECRREFGIEEGAFVVGMVGVNMFRKRLDTGIRTFAKFAADKPEARLVLHCYAGDEEGYDIAHLARFYGIQDKVYVVHWVKPVLSDDELCSLYNTFDVYLNTSGGEGWSFGPAEAAACGVPVVVPDWAATRELWTGAGALISVIGWRHESKWLNTAHAELSVPGGAGELEKLYRNPQYRRGIAADCSARARAMLTWDQVGRGFESLLERAIKWPEPVPVSLNELRKARRQVVRSEVQDRAA
jgi:glycosyltransferase involved in cell wall biosynthesis